MLAPNKSKPAKIKKSNRGWCLFGAVLVATGFGGWLWMSHKNISPNGEDETRRAYIPDVSTKSGGRTGKSTDATGENSRNGMTPPSDGNEGIGQPDTPNVDPKMVGRLVTPPVRKKLFKHVCDAQIGRVLAIKPGGLVLGKLNYHRNHFVENFKKSLADPEPVVFADDDTQEERDLKEAVIEAREELKAALARGEDIAEIMQATENELHEMQQYRMAMREQLLKYQKEEGVSVEDLEDFNAAVNQMLSEKGLEPIASARLKAIKAKLNRNGNY